MIKLIFAATITLVSSLTQASTNSAQAIDLTSHLRDLKHVAARREPQQNGYFILQVHNAANACFWSRPTGQAVSIYTPVY